MATLAQQGETQGSIMSSAENSSNLLVYENMIFLIKHRDFVAMGLQPGRRFSKSDGFPSDASEREQSYIGLDMIINMIIKSKVYKIVPKNMSVQCCKSH